MIQLRSTILIADNTGARKAQMIRKAGQNTDIAGIGDVVTINIDDTQRRASIARRHLDDISRCKPSLARIHIDTHHLFGLRKQHDNVGTSVACDILYH